VNLWIFDEMSREAKRFFCFRSLSNTYNSSKKEKTLLGKPREFFF